MPILGQKYNGLLIPWMILYVGLFLGPYFHERIANCAGPHSTASLAFARCSLGSEGDDWVDGGGAAGWEIASKERNKEKNQRDNSDCGEIAGREAEEHSGD